MNKRVLYSTSSIMTPDKYGEMSKLFISNILSGVFLIDVILIIFLLIVKLPFTYSIILIVLFNIISYVFINNNIFNISRNYYINKMNKLNLSLENESKIDFYEDHLVSRGIPAIKEIYYKEINHVIQTDSSIYLKCSKYNVIVLLEKDKCSRELIEFIENRFFH